MWFSAAISRDYATINEWAGVMARSVDQTKETALMKAVRAQDPQMVHSLAKHEAREVNDRGYTALIIAAINNLGPLCAILAPLESDIVLSGGRTALMMAASVSACSSIEALIAAQHGRRDDNGMTALMYAVIYGNVSAASALVGWEKRILSSENKTALIIAAEHYRKDMIQLLYPHEHGLLPDAENVVLAPYKSIICDMQHSSSHLGSSNSSDTEYEPCSRQRAKSISFSRKYKPNFTESAANMSQRASIDFLSDHQERRSSLDLSWNESHAPHKIHSVRVNFSPQGGKRSSYLNSMHSQQQRSRSVGTSEHSRTATTLAQQYFNTHQYEHRSILQDSLRRKASPRSRSKKFSKPSQQIITKQQFGANQRHIRSRRSSEEYYDQYASKNDMKFMQCDTVPCQSHTNKLRTGLQKQTVFTPTPTPEPNRIDNNLLFALKQHILSLERELLQKDRELQMLASFNENSHKTILALQEQTNKSSPYEITFAQCATRTEITGDCKTSQGIQSPAPLHTTQSDTMKKLQENAYLKQLCASLSLVKEDILLLCNSARHECEQASQEQLATELRKDPGSLDYELEDDTFVVFIPCNHLIDLAHFAMKDNRKEYASITECPRCGTRSTSVITVKT